MKLFTVQFLTAAAILAFASGSYAAQASPAGLDQIQGVVSQAESALTNPTELADAVQNLVQQLQQSMGSNVDHEKEVSSLVQNLVSDFNKMKAQRRDTNDITDEVANPTKLTQGMTSSVTDFVQKLVKEVTASAGNSNNMLDTSKVSDMAQSFVNDLEKEVSSANPQRRGLDTTEVKDMVENLVDEVQQAINVRRDSSIDPSQLTSMLDSLVPKVEQLLAGSTNVRRDASLDGLESKGNDLENGLHKDSLAEIKKQLCGLQSTLEDLMGTSMSANGQATIKKLQQVLSLKCGNHKSTPTTSAHRHSHEHMKNSHFIKSHRKMAADKVSALKKEAGSNLHKAEHMTGKDQKKAESELNSAEHKTDSQLDNISGLTGKISARGEAEMVDQLDDEVNDATKMDTPLLGAAYQSLGGLVRRRRSSV